MSPTEKYPDHWYTGLHAFVMVDHVDPNLHVANVVADLNAIDMGDKGKVIFASTFVGDYVAFAHVRVGEKHGLAGLQDFIEGELWKAGVRCKWAVEVGVYMAGPMMQGTKRMTPEIIALVGIRVKHGHAKRVMRRLGELKGFKGASFVLGDFDIILQLGGDTLDEVVKPTLGKLQRIPGIVSTSTAVADGSRKIKKHAS